MFDSRETPFSACLASRVGRREGDERAGDRHPKLMQISKEITLASCHPPGTLGMQKPKKQRCKHVVEVGGISIDGG